jgi:hypothetical protein
LELPLKRRGFWITFTFLPPGRPRSRDDGWAP